MKFMPKIRVQPQHPMLMVALMSFMGVLTETSMNVTFPALMRQFQQPLSTVQWVTSGYLVVAALVMLTSAYMKRRFTNRQLFMASALLFSVGDLLCGLAGNSVAYGLKRLDPLFRNDANALYNTGQQITGAMGTTVLAILMSSVHRPHFTIAQNVSAGSQLAFYLLISLGVVILGLFYCLLNLHQNHMKG